MDEARAQVLVELRAAIRTERARAQHRLAALTRQFEGIVEASAQANTDDEHDPEGSTIAFERAQVAALRDQTHDRLRELAAAEQRVEDGTADVCARCGGPIGAERLLARPGTRWCRACAP